MNGTTPSENQATDPVRWGRVGAAALGVLLVVLCAAEVGARIEDWVRYRTPFASRILNEGDLAIRDATGRHPAPGVAFRAWRINAVGTRGPEPVAALAERRVIVHGASETFGLYESPDHEYPRRLAAGLGAAGCPADVLNAGFLGMSLPTVEQDLRLRLAALRPKVVVYYPTPPQYLDDDLPTAARPDSSGTVTVPGGSPWRSRFAPRAYDQLKTMIPAVSDLLRRREIAASRGRIAADSLFTAVPESRLHAFEADLRRLVGTVRAIGATPVLATHANGFTADPPVAAARLRAWERFYPRATGATLIAFDAAAAEAIRRVGADSGVAVVDAWRAFHTGRGDSLFADFSHFTDAGADRMAALLRPAVAAALRCAP